jgi:SWI/SNF-related matrix-associated actin-dependent regulator 1 of chromatin subfamily A
MVRRLKRDVLKELPPKRRQVICLPPNGSAGIVKREQVAFQEYEGAIQARRAAMEMLSPSDDKEAYNSAVASLQEATDTAFTEMSSIRREVALAKVPAIIDHIESAYENGVPKIILFGHHREVCNAIYEHFGKCAVRLTGEDTKLSARQASVDRFQTDDSCTLFVGSIKAAGVGHTLTAASLVIFAEIDWTPANITQAEDRAHRIGQNDHVLIQHLVLDGSIDARMAQMCVDKQNIADAALDNNTLVVVETPSGANGTVYAGKPAYPPISDEKRSAAHRAMEIVSGSCDGALATDGLGFNKADSRIGKQLAALSRLSDGQAWLAVKLARKYQRQIPALILEQLDIGCPA